MQGLFTFSIEDIEDEADRYIKYLKNNIAKEIEYENK